MQPGELRARCEKAMGDTGFVVIEIHRKRRRSTLGIRFTEKSGPIGRILEERPASTIASFRADHLLKWLDRQRAAGNYTHE